jgi:hypothetical protein
MPLSAAGSLRDIGARFNVGQDLATAAGIASWPALYIAQNLETAYREKNQLPASAKIAGLTPEELALKDGGSFLVAFVRGEISSVLDLSDRDAIKPFCQRIASFDLSRRASSLARSLGAKPPQLIRTAAMLQRAALSPKWRVIPMQFEVPAPSQVFGELVQSAGYEAMTYQSSQGGGQCVVVFPPRFADSASFVELLPGYPHEVTTPRLDHDTWRTLVTP